MFEVSCVDKHSSLVVKTVNYGNKVLHDWSTDYATQEKHLR
jgi:hypothetical protein